MTTVYTYEAGVEWLDGRRAVARAEGLPDLEVAAPPEFKGPGGLWTPEHLFVGAVASCFVTTFAAIAELSKLEFTALDVGAVGTLERPEGQGYRITEVVLRARLGVARAEDVERAGRLLEKAERNCLVSSSITSTVRLETELFVEEREPLLTAG